MTEKQKLQNLIDLNLDPAELGCEVSRAIIINAQARLDEIANEEKIRIGKLLAEQQRNLVEFSLTF